MSTRAQPPSPSLARVPWTGWALALAAVFVHLPELDGRAPFWRDVHLANLPFRRYLRELLLAGELPQWWPWDAGGAPLLANPPAQVLHPFTLLQAVLTPLAGHVAQATLSTALAMLGACALARALGQSRVASFAAGLVFGANGYLVGLDEQPFMLTAAATIPWYAWALLVAARRGGALRTLPSIVFAAQLLAGDPQASILAAAFGGLVVVARAPSRRSLALAAASPLVAAGLCAVQLLPSLEVIPFTQRAVPFDTAERWSLESRHLLGMIVPLGHAPFDFAASTTVGLPILALACAGLVAARRRPVVAALVAAAVVSAWLALGSGYGMTELARAVVPMWSRLRYPIKSLELTMLAVALLAGEGLHQLAGPRRAQAVRFAAAGAAVMGLVVLGAGHLPGLAQLATLLGSLVLLVAVRPSGEGAVACACAAAAPLLAFACGVVPTTDPAFHDEPALAPVLRGEGVSLAGGALERLDDTRWPDAMQPEVRRHAVGGQGTMMGASWSLPALSIYSLTASSRLVELYVHAKAAGIDVAGKRRVYALLGASHLVVPPAMVGPSDRVVAHEPRFGFTVVENAGALPRAFAVPCARAVSRGPEAEQLFLSSRFRPRLEALVERDGSSPPCPQEGDALVAAAVVARTNASVTVQATLPWDGWLVLNEAWFPGWRAFVDGAETTVEVGNVAMRAVRVPAGRHEVVLRYVTPGLVRGALVSLVSWLALAAAAARGRRQPARA
jgi:hypothetical protein